jgi:hypothetical protein
MSELPYWMQSVQALGPTVVAVIAALIALYIGWRQWRTAHYRLTFDQFEKRFKTYEAVRSIISKQSMGAVTRVDFNAFADGIRNAEFLFDGAAKNFIIQIGNMVLRPAAMMSDADKLRLCEELEAMGLLRRDAHGRRWLTEKGDRIGMAFYAFKMHEAEAEQAETSEARVLQ